MHLMIKALPLGAFFIPSRPPGTGPIVPGPSGPTPGECGWNISEECLQFVTLKNAICSFFGNSTFEIRTFGKIRLWKTDRKNDYLLNQKDQSRI